MVEMQEWFDLLVYVFVNVGSKWVVDLFEDFDYYVYFYGVFIEFWQIMFYINIIVVEDQLEYFGDFEFECKICNINCWNLVVMVIKVNKKSDGIGGYFLIYVFVVELFEVGFNYFFWGYGVG